jgi:hypothetical protein
MNAATIIAVTIPTNKFRMFCYSSSSTAVAAAASGSQTDTMQKGVAWFRVFDGPKARGADDKPD